MVVPRILMPSPAWSLPLYVAGFLHSEHKKGSQENTDCAPADGADEHETGPEESDEYMHLYGCSRGVAWTARGVRRNILVLTCSVVLDRIGCT